MHVCSYKRDTLAAHAYGFCVFHIQYDWDTLHYLSCHWCHVLVSVPRQHHIYKVAWTNVLTHEFFDFININKRRFTVAYSRVLINADSQLARLSYLRWWQNMRHTWANILSRWFVLLSRDTKSLVTRKTPDGEWYINCHLAFTIVNICKEVLYSIYMSTSCTSNQYCSNGSC